MTEIPTLNKITKAKITNIKNANLAIKLLDSKNSLVPKVPLFIDLLMRPMASSSRGLCGYLLTA
jgi:hypothetical protein